MYKTPFLREDTGLSVELLFESNQMNHSVGDELVQDADFTMHKVMFCAIKSLWCFLHRAGLPFCHYFLSGLAPRWNRSVHNVRNIGSLDQSIYWLSAC